MGTSIHYATITGLQPEMYLDIVEPDPRIEEIRILSISDGQFRVQARITEHTISEVFDQFGGRIEKSTLEDTAFHIVGIVPASIDLNRLTETLRSVYTDIELVKRESILTPPVFRTLVEKRLTTRQLNALQSAYFGGYFEEPRTSTGVELGDALGVTRQTFNHHLRVAQ